MTTELDTEATADALLQALRARGFEQAQVSASEQQRCELNLAHNEPSLLRSTSTRRLAATAIVGGRRASAEGHRVDAQGIAALVDELWSAAASAPVDEASAVSSGQRAQIVRGVREADPTALASALRELLAWRAANTPAMMIEEAQAAHVRSRAHTLTFAAAGAAAGGDSRIACDLGWCEASIFGLAREGGRTSSFNAAGGTATALDGLTQRFGIERMMRELVQQVHAQPLGERFAGAVVLAPGAVEDLVSWLLEQLGDGPLIDGSSIYRERVGERIASPLLTLQSRFDAPGCAPVSADAFVAAATTLLDAGVLTQLTPSYYGSRKTGLPHRPVAAQGWELRAGDTPLADLIAGVPRGALVGRLSMGDPAPNGDFSGVIKNSFRIDGGELGPALAETMISGNVARMLQDVRAVSRERIDAGSQALPWLCIEGLHFS